jgi:hypothetical protein
MPYELGLSHRRKARQRRNRVILFFVFLLLLGMAGAYGYYEGAAETERKVRAVEKQVQALSEENTKLRNELEAETARQLEALGEARAWRSRYETEVPKGEIIPIIEAARERLEAGVGPERLAGIIARTPEKRVCDSAPERKRFIVKTPLYSGEASQVAFADGALTITGTGESAVDRSGNLEAWYDPSKPVTIRVAIEGREPLMLDGQLPLAHSVVYGANEYEIAVREGAQSFVIVSALRCDFP